VLRWELMTLLVLNQADPASYYCPFRHSGIDTELS
jgi:hypothetical protein